MTELWAVDDNRPYEQPRPIRFSGEMTGWQAQYRSFGAKT
jgi:hypothetical protein